MKKNAGSPAFMSPEAAICTFPSIPGVGLGLPIV